MSRRGTHTGAMLWQRFPWEAWQPGSTINVIIARLMVKAVACAACTSLPARLRERTSRNEISPGVVDEEILDNRPGDLGNTVPGFSLQYGCLLDRASINISSVLARGDKLDQYLGDSIMGVTWKGGRGMGGKEGGPLTWSYCAMNFRTVMQYARDICHATHTGSCYVLSRARVVFVRASLVSLLRRIHHVGVCDTYKRVREEITMRGL